VGHVLGGVVDCGLGLPWTTATTRW
jgi:hypothetical protein